MSRYFFTIAFLIVLLPSFAQPVNYNTLFIPATLKKNAHSVKREENIEFTVKSIDKASYKVHKVVTVLDEAAKDELAFVQYADKFHSLEDVTIDVLDAMGNKVRRYERSDLARQANMFDLVPDGKFYYLMIPAPTYPVTVKIDYEITYNGILNYPDYDIQLPEQSVEHAVFTAKVPAALDLRFKALNTTLAAAISQDGKNKSYTWTAKELPALEYEEGSAGGLSRYPKILLSPNKFELDGYEGDISSWKNFGYWYGSLAKGADNLSPERKEFFRSLVQHAANDKEKINILYTYLQNNFRYVSIQLGIGGFKPFEADFVDRKKYGDCKALSNYMQACLSAVGIKSYQALINAEYNKEPVEADFPYNGFNHCIVCVPMASDSIWLECTSATNDFGVLGSFTENRNALLITEDGGKLVATPRSKASENVFACTSLVTLNEDGSGKAAVSITTSGEYKQDFLQAVADQKKDVQKKFLVQQIGFIQPDEFDVQYDKMNRLAPTTIQMSIEKIPDFTAGTKFFLNPRIYKLWGYALPKAENRTQDFYFEHPMIKTDTTVYQLPAGYNLETLPKPKSISFEYGSFTSSYQYDDTKKQVITTARLILNEYKIPAAKFAVTKKFFNDVLAEYAEKIVIKRIAD